MDARVSTATIHAALDRDVDIAAILSASSDAARWRAACSDAGCTVTVRTPGVKRNRTREVRSFYNSVTLVVPRLPGQRCARKQCAKVFTNGSLHVTGGESVAGCLAIAQVVARVAFATGATAGVERASVRSHKLQLINVIARFTAIGKGDMIDLERACDELNACSGGRMTATYNREIYAGMNVKVSVPDGRTVTALLFASGNLIFTGLKARDELETCARAFLGFLVPRLPRLMLAP